MRAADLFAKKVTQADIGRELEVSHQTVSDWHKLWKVGGKQALKRTGAARSSSQGDRRRPGQGGTGPAEGCSRPMGIRPICGPWPVWPR